MQKAMLACITDTNMFGIAKACLDLRDMDLDLQEMDLDLRKHGFGFARKHNFQNQGLQNQGLGSPEYEHMVFWIRSGPAWLGNVPEYVEKFFLARRHARGMVHMDGGVLSLLQPG